MWEVRPVRAHQNLLPLQAAVSPDRACRSAQSEHLRCHSIWYNILTVGDFYYIHLLVIQISLELEYWTIMIRNSSAVDQLNWRIGSLFAVKASILLFSRIACRLFFSLKRTIFTFLNKWKLNLKSFWFQTLQKSLIKKITILL